MKNPRWRCFLLLVVCGATPVFFPGAQAQTPAAPPAMTVTGATNNIPPLPVFQPRVEMFRKLLAMSADEQQAWLSNRPPEVRGLLAAKIQEYGTMKVEQREAVLRATELHEYLQYFLNLPEADRTAQLPQVPIEYREVVSNRVRQFALLPPELQQEVLAGKTTANYFLNPAPPMPPPVRTMRPPSTPPPPLPPVSPWGYLSRLSPEERQNIYASFQHFFDLNEDDRQKILATLPPDERAQTAKTLSDLERLPREQREQGLLSLSRLAAMTDDQRQAFFKNAALWRELPPTERQTWHKLVVHLPPLPPGAEQSPLPPSAGASHDATAVATNPAN